MTDSRRYPPDDDFSGPEVDERGLDDFEDIREEGPYALEDYAPAGGSRAPLKSRRRRLVFPDRLILSRRAYTLAGVGMGLLLVWTFILGIVVGHGLIFESQAFQAIEKRISRQPAAPNAPLDVEKGRPEEEGLDPDEPETPPTSGPEAAASPDQTKLTFYKTLSEGKVQTDISPPTPRKPEAGKEAAAEPPAAKAPEKTEPAAVKPASELQPPAPGPEPSKTEPPAVKPAEPPVRDERGTYVVQVAASSDIGKAEQLVSAMKAQGFAAYHTQYQADNQVFYRVRIGPFVSRAQAEGILARVKEIGHGGAYITEKSEKTE